MTTWINRWFDWISDKPVAPGVWKRRDGGFRIRARINDAATGKRHEINRALPDCRRQSDAIETLVNERNALRERIEAGPVEVVETTMPLFATYAVGLYKRKLNDGKAIGVPRRGVIVSEKGSQRWNATLLQHLIPAFGAMPVDKIRRREIQAWLDRIELASAPRRHRKRSVETESGYSPRTVNSWLAILRTVLTAAAREFEFAPVDFTGLEKATAPVYTDDEPNSIRPADVPAFLAKAQELYPAHYGMIFLGVITGLRPSTLRPLRRQGDRADINWTTGVLEIRRSQTVGEPMLSTKTGTTYRIDLPPEAVSVLESHVALMLRRERHRLERKRLPVDDGPVAKSELLFPTTKGGYRSASCLDKPFRVIGKAIGLTYEVSPRAMRRTYQDLARVAGVTDIVTRSISGHATEKMQHHYSTVGGDEKRAALAKVIDLAAVRASRAA